MAENSSNPEPRSGPEIVTRARLRSTFANLTQGGITDPRDLSQDDPEVIRAWELFARWQDRELARIHSYEGGVEARKLLLHRVSSDTLLTDAGFTDPDYLQTVIDDLGQCKSDADALSARAIGIAIGVKTQALQEAQERSLEMPTTHRRNAVPKTEPIEATGAPIDVDQVIRVCEGIIDLETLNTLKAEASDPDDFFQALCEELVHEGVTNIPLFFHNRGVVI